MKKIFRKLLVRNIRANIKQFLSVILIVLLSTMLLSGFIVNSSTLDKSISNYFADTKLADLWVYTDKVTDADEEFYASCTESYSKRLYLETSAEVVSSRRQNNTKIYVSDGKVSTPYVESGQKGCLIDKNVAKNNNIKVTFDELEFEYNMKIGENIVPLQFKMRITGTMSLDECADTYSSWPVFVDEDLFLLYLNNAIANAGSEFRFEKLPYNQVLIKTNNQEETKQKINNYYETSESKLIYLFDRTSIESVVLLNSEIKQSKRMILVFPIIFLVVSVLVILTTIDQLILQEKTKIGTLKSIGIPDKKILRHYSGYGAVLCGIGSVIGLILGPLVIPNVMLIKYDLVYSLPSDYIKLNIPWYLLFVLVFMILLGYLVSFFACHNILHKKPIECLRQEIKYSFKSRGKNTKNVPLPLKMAMRNIKIKPVRTIMATIGIAGCVALLLCGFGIGNTIDHSVKNDFGGVFKYDVTSTYTNSNFEEKLNEIEGIKKYEKYTKFYTEVVAGKIKKNINVYEIEPNSTITTIALKENETCISKSLADELKIKKGDTVSISCGENRVDVKIDKIIVTSAFNGIYSSKQFSLTTIVKTYGVWIECDNPENVFVEVNKINGTNTAHTMKGMIDNIESKVSSIDLMTTTLKVFAISLAVVVLLNLIFLILKERVREIATLKVLGEGLMSITLSILFEILFMGIIGNFIGMLLGFPLLVWVLAINKVEVLNFIYYLSPLSFVWSSLLIFATIIIVCLLSVFKVKKINMIESLKSIE